MTRALVLNATYEPLAVVSLQRAVLLVLADKAVVVEPGEGQLRSPRLTIDVPSVVRLSHFVRVPYRRRVPLSRRGVLQRDGGRCVYCGLRAETIDHVVPRSRGGDHAWENVVAACGPCNHRKSDRLLSELGWSLPVTPREPSRAVSLVFGCSSGPAAWNRYLLPWQSADEAAS